MKAFVLNQLDTLPSLIDVPIPKPKNGEVLVKIAFCGVNQVDLKVLAGTYKSTTQYPLTMGAEPVGILPNGQHVAINSYLFCGNCRFCKKKEYLVCAKGRMILGVHRNGGFAEFMVVPKKNLVEIPEKLRLDRACALTVSAGTAYRMIYTKAKVAKEEYVVITAAASGVGVYSCQLARLSGANVIAIVGSDKKLKKLKELGIKHIVNYTKVNWQEEVSKISHDHLDVLIDTVGGKIFESLYPQICANGRIVLCGATENPIVTLNLIDLYNKQKTIMGSSGRTQQDLQKLFRLAVTKKISPIIDSVFPITQIPQALEKLRSRNVFGKILIKVA